MASAARPDVVLLDIVLPGMNGYQVARRLREKSEFKTVTLCALTGFTRTEADHQCQQQTGFDRYYVNLETPLPAHGGTAHVCKIPLDKVPRSGWQPQACRNRRRYRRILLRMCAWSALGLRE